VDFLDYFRLGDNPPTTEVDTLKRGQSGAAKLNLILRYEDNGTLHDDIQLQLENETWTCDSYYFALDRNVRDGDESATKVKAVLRKLLEHWLKVATKLPDASTAFLPFDFSDQCTGWLRCQRIGEVVLLSLGWSLVEGWSFFPSEADRFVSDLADFKPSTSDFSSSREELIQAISKSLADVD
jgi:hypothetical protein